MQELAQLIPEVIVVGDIEMLFAGMAIAVGAPKLARKALNKRYGGSESDEGQDTESSK